MRNFDASFITKHFLVLSLFLTVGMAQCSEKESETVIMKHVVFNSFHPNVTQGEIDEIIAMYANLKNIVPEMKEFKWGKDLGPGIEDRANGLTYSYESTFHSVEDFTKFFNNSLTKEFGKRFWPATAKYAVLNYILNTTFPYQWSLPYRWAPPKNQSRQWSLQ